MEISGTSIRNSTEGIMVLKSGGMRTDTLICSTSGRTTINSTFINIGMMMEPENIFRLLRITIVTGFVLILIMSEISIDRDYYKNGQIWYEWHILNGVTHGPQRGWYKNGMLKYDCVMIGNRFIGMHLRWNEDGTRVHIQGNGPRIEFMYGS